MDDFTQNELNSPCFVRTVAKYIRKSLNSQFEETEQNERMTDNPWKLPASLSSSSDPSEEDKCSNYERNHRANTEETRKGNRKHRNDRKEKHKRSSSSSESLISTPGLSNSSRGFFLSKSRRPKLAQGIRKAEATESTLPALQTVKKYYNREVDCGTY